MDIVDKLRGDYHADYTDDAASEIEQLRQRVAELEENWRLSEVASAKRQMNVIKLTAERDKATQYWQIAEGRCDALMKQRDELVAALEQFATWGRMQHKAQSKGCHATFDMMALKDEIDFAEAAIASVKEKS